VAREPAAQAPRRGALDGAAGEGMSMRRTISILAGLLVLQLALAGLLAIRTDPLRGTAPDLPLLHTAITGADHVVIESKSEPGEAAETTRVELSRHDKSWTIDNYYHAPAAASRIDAMLGRLSGLKRGLPIATSAAALERFRVADQDYARRLTLGAAGKTLDTVYFGTSAGAHSVDARSGADRVVFSVDYATYEIPVLPADWFDGDLLSRKAADLVSIGIDYGDHRPMRLERAPGKDGAAGSWRLSPLQPGQSFSMAHADDLATALAGLHVDSVLGTDARPEWQQGHPLISWTLSGADQHPETWTLSKPDGNADYRVLKSSAHPWYFSLNPTAAASLLSASDRDQLLGIEKPAPKPAPQTAPKPAPQTAPKPAPSH
jgi:hypothetical protein